MAIPNYTLGYPPDGSSLGGTKVVIRDNLDGTFETLGIDHINNNGDPGSQPPGYHTIIHEVTQTNVNSTIGYNQVFSGVPGTLIVNGVTTPFIPNNNDTQLYALTSGSGLSQLTGSFIDVTNNLKSVGYQWLGSILIQWGFVPVTTASPSFVSQSYNIAFPQRCLSMWTQAFANNPTNPSGSQATVEIKRSGSDKTQFQWAFITNGTSYEGFMWTAIGN